MLQADKDDKKTTVTKNRDYSRRSSNNIMPCLLCVDETGIEPNPICFESRFSAPPHYAFLILEGDSKESEMKGKDGSSIVQVRVQILT